MGDFITGEGVNLPQRILLDQARNLDQVITIIEPGTKQAGEIVFVPAHKAKART